MDIIYNKKKNMFVNQKKNLIKEYMNHCLFLYNKPTTATKNENISKFTYSQPTVVCIFAKLIKFCI